MLSRKASPLKSPVTGAKQYAAGFGGLIGYARCSTVLQYLTAQRQVLAALGVPGDWRNHFLRRRWPPNYHGGPDDPLGFG